MRLDSSEKSTDNKPLVSILCQTFNHGLYIRQCLDGLMMQNTSFPFEVLIHDDASTDGTADIIKEYETKYPAIIKPIYQIVNQFSQGKKVFSRIQLPRAKSKYLALCEGDDYWTDPYKLQKQIDFLEKNSEYGLIYSKVKCFDQETNKFEREPWGGPSTKFDALIIRNTIPTLTTVFRTDICRQYLEEIKPERYNWKLGDYPLWLYFAMKSRVFFLNEITGVYRISKNSISHCSDMEKQEAYIKSIYAIKNHLLEFSKINFNRQELNEALFECLGTNALLMNNRHLAYDYFSQIRKMTLKKRTKKIISRFNLTTLLYSKILKGS